MADNAPVMIWMSDTTKLLTYFNKGWTDFTGRKLEEELGEGWSVHVHQDDIVQLREIYFKAFDKRVPFKMVYRLKRSDGEYR